MESSPAAAVPPAAVLPLLSGIERLPHGATGALILGEGPTERGAVLVESGRVCWAVATKMRKRLTDLLRFQTTPPLDSNLVEDIYRNCRKQSQPLGEALVASGLVPHEGLRRALRQHNAEALALLSLSADVPKRWQAHSRARYDARYTFSSAELVCSVGALNAPELARRSRLRLREVLRDAGWGASFIARSDGPWPIGEERCSELTARELMDVGRWAMEALFISGEVAGSRPIVTSVATGGSASFAWSEQGVIYAGTCDNSRILARCLNRLTAARSF